MRDAVHLILLCCVAGCVAGCVSWPALTLAQSATPTPVPVPAKANARPPQPTDAPAEPFDAASIEKMATQCVTLATEAGLIELEMFAEAAPETVRNFLNLSATGAFETTTFSRVVKDFVIQGGNLSTHQKLTVALARRSRRTILDEPNPVKHVRGIVSMARPDAPHQATTNFFILVSPASFLDGKFTAFARVTRGMEVVDQINHAPVDGEKPRQPVRIQRTSVSTCPAPTPRPATNP